MASRRQNQANRRNARHSTGPRTEEGRQASSLNALKHGLRSRLTVIPGENEADFHALFDAFAEEAAPQSPRDLAAVRKIAVCEWRLRRIAAIETEMFTQALKQPAEAEATIDNIEAIVERLAVQQAAPPQSTLAILAQRFLKGEIKHFGALTRYEASLNRQYNQAWLDLDSRPEPGFREVYDPAEESKPESEPHYTAPTPDALAWKSATDRYAETQPFDPSPPPPDTPSVTAETQIDPATSEPAPQTAQTKPIPESDTPARAPVIRFPGTGSVREMLEWGRQHANLDEALESAPGDEKKEGDDLLEPGA
jgi:hypothetical protein